MVGSLVALSQTRLIDYCIHSCYSSVLNTRWSCFHVDLERCIVCCRLRAVLYHSYSFKYIQVFGGMGRKRHWWKKKLEFGKDFSLLVSISLDNVCVSFPVFIPVSIPLDKVSIRSKLQCLKQDLVSTLPRSWVDITPSSDTALFIIKCRTQAVCNSPFTSKPILTGVYTLIKICWTMPLVRFYRSYLVHSRV